MSNKEVIIIGAGIAGLSAGCYLQMNGYNSKIFELHKSPGGLCTSWKRGEYTFDGCIHWLVGSGPSHDLHHIWSEVGAIHKDVKFVDPEEFVRIEGEEGQHFTIYTDVDNFEAEMKRLSPDDKVTIEELTNAIRLFVKYTCSRGKPPTIPPPSDEEAHKKVMAEIQAFFQKWQMISFADYTTRLTDPFLREAFPTLFGGSDAPIIALIATLGYMHAKTAGYPIGGSLAFAKSIEKRFLNLGGKIHYNSRVTKILVEEDTAVGIQLENGQKHQASIVISAADGYDTIFNILEGKYINEEISGYYKNLELFPPICQVSLGVANDFTGISSTIHFPLSKPLTVDPKTTQEKITVKIYNFDPTLAPPGKTVVITILESRDYEFWVNLRKNNREQYRQEKDRLAKDLLERLEQRFPGISSKVEVVDVATPATFIRYTNNWKGSYEGWLFTSKVGESITETLPGLANFYMVGHWTRPGGGLPPAALSARKIVNIICNKDDVSFKTFTE